MTTLLESIAGGEVEPQGEITVEIRNERGRVIDRETKPNFIGKAWRAFARANLRRNWMGYGLNTQFTGQTVANTGDQRWPAGKNTQPALPISHLCAWNDTTPEDSVNEHQYKLPASGLVAWASRHPFGSSSGARGNVDTTESVTQDLLSRFVFNWTGAQGNGTFQSVGWLGLGAPGIPKANFGIHYRRQLISATMTPGSLIAAATSLYNGGGWIDPATGIYYFPVKRGNTTGQTIRIMQMQLGASLVLSDANTLGTLAPATGLVATSASDEVSPTSMVNSLSSAGLHVIGRDGSNTIFTYSTAAGQNAIHRWGKVGPTGVSTTYVGGNGSTQGYWTGCVIGGFAYLMSNWQHGGVFKHSIADGSLVATFTLDPAIATLMLLVSTGNTAPRVHGVTTDGTDIIAIYSGNGGSSTGRYVAVRISPTTGLMTEIIGTVPGYITSSQPSETASAPYAGLYNYPATHLTQPSVEVLLQPGSSSAAIDTATVLAVTQYDTVMVTSSQPDEPWSHLWMWYDGSLFFLSNPAGILQGTSQWNATAYRRGFDLGSRVLLSTPKVKSSGQVMKITYDITLPGWL